MDCLYCTMFHKANYDATYYFEYVLETYNNYVQKLMHKTCEIYYNKDAVFLVGHIFCTG